VKVLLDTHALLWFAADDPRLSRKAVATLEQDDTELYISVASVWEMAIKVSVGRLRLPDSVEHYVAAKLDEGYRLLPVDWVDAAGVERLPWHHRDPFDRILASQALAREIPIVTRDRVFRKYRVQTIW
jgi:PIN domain nuclease of toxin-antitoxin system